MSDADIDAKFRMLASPVIGAEAAGAISAVLWRVDELKSVALIPLTETVANCPIPR
jgi:hypothetical protein